MEHAQAERILAQADATFAMLTGLMRRPLKTIDAETGRMERESPLFFGKGENPSMFD
jgi:hypothetical protein